MSLASSVVLLQTALSLLTLLNSNPSLPQSMRDNAQQEAQQAISEAHAALASQATSADVAEDDIASSADEAIAQAALAKTPSTQTVLLAPSSTKAGPAYFYPNSSLTPGAELTTDAVNDLYAGIRFERSQRLQRDEETGVCGIWCELPAAHGPMRWISLFRSKLAARTTSRTCGCEPATPAPGFHQKD